MVPSVIKTHVSFSRGFPLMGSLLGGQDRLGGGTLCCSIWVSFNQAEQRAFTLHAISGVHSAKKVRQKGGWEGSGREWIVFVKRDEPPDGTLRGHCRPRGWSKQHGR